MRRVALILFLVVTLAFPAFASHQPLLFNSNGSALATSAGTAYVLVNGSLAPNGTEANRNFIVPCSGYLEKLYVEVPADPGVGNSYTFLVRVNGGDSSPAVSCAITSGNTTASDLTNRVHVNAGDRVDIAVTTAGTPPANEYLRGGILFTPDTDNETVLSMCSASSTADGNAYYISLGGSATASTTEANNSFVIPCAGQITSLYVYGTTAPGTGKNLVFKVRYASPGTGAMGDTSMAVTLTGTGTGDGKTTGNHTTDPVSLSAGDVVSLSMTLDSGGTTGLFRTGVRFVPTTPGYFVHGHSHNGSNLNTGSTRYNHSQGYNSGWSSNNALFPQKSPVAFTAKSVYAQLGADPGSTKSYQLGYVIGTTTQSLATTITGNGTNSVTGNNSTDISVAAGNLVQLFCTPAGTPTATTAMVSIAGYIAPEANNTTLTNAVQTMSATATVTAAAGGTTYYVDPNGNDTYDGTEQSHTTGSTGPWKTISKVNSAQASLVAGDQVLFKKGGNWIGTTTLQTTANGSSGSVITYGAYGTGDDPILVSGQTLTTWTGPDVTYGYYTNTEVAAGRGTSFGVTEEVTTTGGALTPNSDINNLAAGQFWYNNATGTIYYKPTTGVPSDHLVVAHWASHYMYTGCAFLTFQNIVFAGAGVTSNNTNGQVHDITYSYCTFRDCESNGLGYWTHATNGEVYNITIDNCTFNYNYNNVYFTDGAYVGNYGITFTNNQVLNTAKTRTGNWFSADSDHDGVSCQNVYNSTFSGNTFSGGIMPTSAGINFWVGGIAAEMVLPGIVVSNNFFHNFQGNGVMIGGSAASKVTSLIYNNIFSNITQYTPFGFQHGAAIFIDKPNLSTKVYNNTIKSCDIGIYIYDNYPGGADIKNNIIDACNTYQVRKNTTTNTSTTINYNDVYPNSGNCMYYNGSARTWAYWTGTLGYEANAANADPAFVNAGGSYILATDFLLGASTPTSISRGGADVSATVAADYAGTSRTAPLSMGAYEYDANSPPHVSTQAVTAISFAAQTATGNGTIIDAGGGTISENGIVWAITANPTTSDNKVTSGDSSGAYTADLTSLNKSVLLHARAYAINEVGTAYGDDVTFILGSGGGLSLGLGLGGNFPGRRR